MDFSVAALAAALLYLLAAVLSAQIAKLIRILPNCQADSYFGGGRTTSVLFLVNGISLNFLEIR
ncbi:MAG: hypothetical protein E2O38_01750 [Proteobacteria bacterium]|nr:MAG: hypothetical protein E2O38_01750 [Pseudomonadota bacterium]